MIARRPAREAGFSLVEMLVVLALLGMVAGLLAGGLGLARAALQSLTRVPQDDVATAQRILRARLERAAPGSLAGTDRALGFIAPPLDRDAPGAMARFRLSRTPGGDLALATPAGGPAVVLLAGVGRIDIAYADRAAGSWRRNWDQRTLPRLIRVRVQRTSAGGEPWPDLIVEPRVTG